MGINISKNTVEVCMYITQKEVHELFKISRATLLQWEEKGIIKEIITLPNSSHRRYLKAEIFKVLGVEYA